MTTTYLTSARTVVAGIITSAGGWDAVTEAAHGTGERSFEMLKEADDLRAQAERVEGDAASLLHAQATYAVGASKFGEAEHRSTVPAIGEYLGTSKAKTERLILLGLALHADIDAADLRGLLNDITVCRNLGGKEEQTVPALLSRNPVKAMRDLRASLESLKVERVADDADDAGEGEGGTIAPSEKTPAERVQGILSSIGGMSPVLAGFVKDMTQDDAVAFAVAWSQVIQPVNDAIRAQGVTRDMIRDHIRAVADANAQTTEEAAA